MFLKPLSAPRALKASMLAHCATRWAQVTARQLPKISVACMATDGAKVHFNASPTPHPLKGMSGAQVL